MVEVKFVPHDRALELWPVVHELLAEKGSWIMSVYTEEGLFNLVQNRILDMWVGMREGVIEGVAFCAWEIHEKVRYYHILQAMGSNPRLYANAGIPLIEDWAYGFGATEVVIEGRPGWKHLLQKHGYLTPTVRLRKNLRKARSH